LEVLITRVIRNAPNNFDNFRIIFDLSKVLISLYFVARDLIIDIILMETEITDADLIEHLQYQVSQQQKPKVQRLANPEKLPRYLLLKNTRLSLSQQYQIIS
jgi:hypothetical protein